MKISSSFADTTGAGAAAATQEYRLEFLPTLPDAALPKMTSRLEDTIRHVTTLGTGTSRPMGLPMLVHIFRLLALGATKPNKGGSRRIQRDHTQANQPYERAE